MSVDIRLDKRYKVTNEIVKEMRILFKKGESIHQIAKRFKVSYHTPYYWIKDEYRRKKRIINAKRISTTNERVKSLKIQKKLFKKMYAIGYIAKQVNAYQYKKEDAIILGISMKEHWIPYLKENFKKGSIKIEG